MYLTITSVEDTSSDTNTKYTIYYDTNGTTTMEVDYSSYTGSDFVWDNYPNNGYAVLIASSTHNADFSGVIVTLTSTLNGLSTTVTVNMSDYMEVVELYLNIDQTAMNYSEDNDENYYVLDSFIGSCNKDDTNYEKNIGYILTDTYINPTGNLDLPLDTNVTDFTFSYKMDYSTNGIRHDDSDTFDYLDFEVITSSDGSKVLRITQKDLSDVFVVYHNKVTLTVTGGYGNSSISKTIAIYIVHPIDIIFSMDRDLTDYYQFKSGDSSNIIHLRNIDEETGDYKSVTLYLRPDYYNVYNQHNLSPYPTYITYKSTKTIPLSNGEYTTYSSSDNLSNHDYDNTIYGKISFGGDAAIDGTTCTYTGYRNEESDMIYYTFEKYVYDTLVCSITIPIQPIFNDPDIFGLYSDESNAKG